MKKKAGNLVICIIFLAGLSLLLYPFVANQWNNYRQKQLISGYEQAVSEKEAAEGIDYDAERKKAEEYNELYFHVFFLIPLHLQSQVE